jgi:hypothetical protein
MCSPRVVRAGHATSGEGEWVVGPRRSLAAGPSWRILAWALSSSSPSAPVSAPGKPHHLYLLPPPLPIPSPLNLGISLSLPIPAQSRSGGTYINPRPSTPHSPHSRPSHICPRPCLLRRAASQIEGEISHPTPPSLPPSLAIRDRVLSECALRRFPSSGLFVRHPGFLGRVRWSLLLGFGVPRQPPAPRGASPAFRGSRGRRCP